MRRTALLLSALLVSVLPGGASATSRVRLVYDPPVGGFQSENVTYVATIPVDSPGVGGRVLKVGNQVRFYVTGAKGLTIYDVTKPDLPGIIGVLPLPHFQNEAVAVSDDGKRVIIAGSTANSGLHVIDTSNPADPKRVGFLGAGHHTAMCADAACDWVYGSGGGIYDVRDPANPKAIGKNWGPGGHALNRDAAGIVVSDSTNRLVLDVRDPASPKVLAQGKATVKLPDGLLQHNNVRPRAEQWVPRDPAAPDYKDPLLRPGELLVGNSESNVRTQCGSNAGGLSSWSMLNFDRGQALKQLEVFRPVNGTWADGNPAVNGLGCSGHWFTVRDGIIAASWYEHGVRFIKVDQATGKFQQLGFFQPVATEAGAAHWIDDSFVYSVDYARGIDILKFDRTKPIPTEDEFVASWLANLGVAGPAAAAERFLCRVASREASSGA